MGGKIADKNTRTLLTIPKELKTKLEEVAKEQNRSLNNLIITILKDYVSTLEILPLKEVGVFSSFLDK